MEGNKAEEMERKATICGLASGLNKLEFVKK